MITLLSSTIDSEIDHLEAMECIFDVVSFWEDVLVLEGPGSKHHLCKDGMILQAYSYGYHSSLNKLQKIENIACHVMHNPKKYDHITISWLHTTMHSVIMYQFANILAPPFKHDLLEFHLN